MGEVVERPTLGYVAEIRVNIGENPLVLAYEVRGYVA